MASYYNPSSRLSTKHWNRLLKIWGVFLSLTIWCGCPKWTRSREVRLIMNCCLKNYSKGLTKPSIRIDISTIEEKW